MPQLLQGQVAHDLSIQSLESSFTCDTLVTDALDHPLKICESMVAREMDNLLLIPDGLHPPLSPSTYGNQAIYVLRAESKEFAGIVLNPEPFISICLERSVCSFPLPCWLNFRRTLNPWAPKLNIALFAKDLSHIQRVFPVGVCCSQPHGDVICTTSD